MTETKQCSHAPSSSLVLFAGALTDSKHLEAERKAAAVRLPKARDMDLALPQLGILSRTYTAPKGGITLEDMKTVLTALDTAPAAPTVILYDIETVMYNREPQMAKGWETCVRQLSLTKFRTDADGAAAPSVWMRDILVRPPAGVRMGKVSTGKCGRGTQTFAQLWPEVVKFCGETGDNKTPVLLIAHNGTTFDERIIAEEIKRHNLAFPEHWLFADSLRLAKRVVSQSATPAAGQYTLGALMKRLCAHTLDLEHADRVKATLGAYGQHHADFDAVMLRAVLASYVEWFELCARARKSLPYTDALAAMATRWKGRSLEACQWLITPERERLLYTWMVTLIGARRGRDVPMYGLRAPSYVAKASAAASRKATTQTTQAAAPVSLKFIRGRTMLHTATCQFVRRAKAGTVLDPTPEQLRQMTRCKSCKPVVAVLTTVVAAKSV